MERYSEYKDNGIKRLGEIPGHWELRKMKYTFDERSQKGFPNEPLLAATQNHGVILKSQYENRTVEAVKSLDTLKLVEIGDFVISLRSFQGGLEYAHNRGIISPAYTILTPTHIKASYFKHLSKSDIFISLLKSSVTGIREGQNIDYNKLKESLLPIPPEEEQKAMGCYLDAATSKIDKAIDMQQKMIDLLNERKQIIIQNAVTKGLDENVEMKDSGVEWIGMIPKHWKIIRLKNVFYKRIAGSWGNEQNVSPKNTVCLRIADFEYSRLQFKKRENYTIRSYTAKEIENKKLSKGDLLIEKSGGGEKSPVGRCVVYNLEIPDVMYANFMEKLSTRGNVDSYFICYLLSCFYSQGMIWPYVKATTGIQNLDIASLLSKEYIFVPPKSEQQAIVAYLDKQMQRFDSAITNCQRQITLLQERKQIIINEVVTGKVKVS